MRDAYQVLPPILAGLARDRAANGGKGTSADAIEWHHQLVGKRKYDEVIAQVGLVHAAIHTTEDLPFETLTQLAEHPEVILQVRKEIVHAISTYGTSKMGVYHMQLLDSIIKETKRLDGVALAIIN